jgi:hypothetical protein
MTMTDTEDRLDQLRDIVTYMRDLELEIKDLRELLTAKEKEHWEMRMSTLPDLFQQSGVDRVDIAATANLPGYQAVMSDYYHAKISTDWSEAEKEEAYNWLEARGLGDIIKRTVYFEFGLKENDRFKKFMHALAQIGIIPNGIKQSVPWATLTATIKEIYKSGKHLGDKELRLLGATVSKVVNLKEKKED